MTFRHHLAWLIAATAAVSRTSTDDLEDSANVAVPAKPGAVRPALEARRKAIRASVAKERASVQPHRLDIGPLPPLAPQFDEGAIVPVVRLSRPSGLRERTKAQFRLLATGFYRLPPSEVDAAFAQFEKELQRGNGYVLVRPFEKLRQLSVHFDERYQRLSFTDSLAKPKRNIGDPPPPRLTVNEAWSVAQEVMAEGLPALDRATRPTEPKSKALIARGWRVYEGFARIPTSRINAERGKPEKMIFTWYEHVGDYPILNNRLDITLATDGALEKVSVTAMAVEVLGQAKTVASSADITARLLDMAQTDHGGEATLSERRVGYSLPDNVDQFITAPRVSGSLVVHTRTPSALGLVGQSSVQANPRVAVMSAKGAEAAAVVGDEGVALLRGG